MHYFLLIVLLAFSYCSPTTKWDLSKPITLKIDNNFPKSRDLTQENNKILFATAFKEVISSLGGTVVEYPTNQIFTLHTTNESNCKNPDTLVYTPSPNLGDIYFCTTKTENSPYEHQQAWQAVAHELGHALSFRREHLGGEGKFVDYASCPSHDVMSNNIGCRKIADKFYTARDISYICSTGYTIGGKCSTN